MLPEEEMTPVNLILEKLDNLEKRLVLIETHLAHQKGFIAGVVCMCAIIGFAITEAVHWWKT